MNGYMHWAIFMTLYNQLIFKIYYHLIIQRWNCEAVLVLYCHKYLIGFPVDLIVFSIASQDLEELIGPTSYYDRWLRWQSQTQKQQTYQHIVDELTKTLQAEPVELSACTIT